MTNRSRWPWPFLLLLVLVCCNDDGLEIDYSGFDCVQNNPNYQPEPIPAPEGTHTLTLRPNKTSTITGDGTDASLEITNGRNRLFHYRYRLQASDTLSRELYFEIAPGIDQFTVSNQALNDIRTYLFISCSPCEDGLEGVFRVENGCIIGQRLDANNWQIQININTTGNGQYYSLMSEGIYQKAD